MTGAPTGPFHLVDAGWGIVFSAPTQRPTMGAANLGALPYWRMIRGPLGPWVVVPLRDAEALWIAITCGRADGVRGATVGGAVLAISRVIPLKSRAQTDQDGCDRAAARSDRSTQRACRPRAERDAAAGPLYRHSLALPDQPRHRDARESARL